jgi:DUF4097 and DUF4098 domain-containing protein YvlB
MRSERYDTPGPIRLNIEVPAGRVRVETADAAETTLDLEPGHDDDASREAVENARIEFRGDELSVVVPEQQRTFGISFGRRAAVIATVRCPHGSSVEIKTRSADVDARGRYWRAVINTTSGDVVVGEVEGDADFNTVSGDLRVGPVGGRVSANTVSGDVVLERAGGKLSVNCVSGDLTVREAASSVNVQTISGDVQLESVEAGDVELNSISGDLRVGIKRGSRVGVDATAVSGDLDSDIELGSDEGSPGDGDDGPLVDLRARTVSGDLRITRA